MKPILTFAYLSLFFGVISAVLTCVSALLMLKVADPVAIMVNSLLLSAVATTAGAALLVVTHRLTTIEEKLNSLGGVKNPSQTETE